MNGTRYLLTRLTVTSTVLLCACIALKAAPQNLLDIAEQRLATCPVDKHSRPLVKYIEDKDLQYCPVAVRGQWEGPERVWFDAVAMDVRREAMWQPFHVQANNSISISVMPKRNLYSPLQNLVFHRHFTIREFEFHFFLPSFAELSPKTPVHRVNPGGWAVQPFESINPGFLPSFFFAVVEKGTMARATLSIIDGSRSIIAQEPLNISVGYESKIADVALLCTSAGFWGALGESVNSEDKQAMFSNVWLYEVDNQDPEAATIKVWTLPTDENWLSESARAEGATEEVKFLVPSLAKQPEMGACVWRRRELTAGEQGNGESLRVYDLLLWRPEETRIVDLYAEYRGPSVEKSWRLDAQGRWEQVPFIRNNQTAEHLGINSEPCVAISPEGDRIAYLRGMALVVATVSNAK